jgi:TDG/mug DNA glycosylase family protein
MSLPDLLKEDLLVVFAGTAVTKSSKAAEVYYASSGNIFYSVLQKTKITTELITPSCYQQLVKLGVGLTDLVKHKTGLDNELSDEDFDRDGFIKKIEYYKPRVVCFNGKLAASYFLYGKKKTKKVKYGLQKETIGKTLIFVAPSTAATARKYWDEKHWFDLSELVKEQKNKP